MAKIQNTNAAADVQDIQQSFHHPGFIADASKESLLLTGRLQSTLELGKILELFHAEVSSLVPHDGLAYINKSEDYAMDLGEAARHRCRYQLVLQDESMGELVFNRQTKFTDQELEQIDDLMTALIHPLHNALLYKQAMEKARRDPLTGIGNRAAMDMVLVQEIDLATRYDASLAAMMLDIDHFKQVNDSYGHTVGDAVLKHVADIMVECMRRSDIVYRYGGEEFVILLRNTDTPGAKLLAERIRRSVESGHFNYGDFKIRLTLSAGISSVQEDDTEKSLLDRCDRALYEAKKNGRNCIVVVAE